MAATVTWMATLLLLISVTSILLEKCEAVNEDWDESYMAETKSRLARVVSKVKPARQMQHKKEETETETAVRAVTLASYCTAWLHVVLTCRKPVVQATMPRRRSASRKTQCHGRVRKRTVATVL